MYPLYHLWVSLSTCTTLTMEMTVYPLYHLWVSLSPRTTLTMGMTVYPLYRLWVSLSTRTTLTVGMTVYPLYHLWVSLSPRTTLTVGMTVCVPTCVFCGYITESVDSVCRDTTYTQYMPIQKNLSKSQKRYTYKPL